MQDKQENSVQRAFGLIIIGDEILFGTRRDRHFGYFRKLLLERGLILMRSWTLADDSTSLTAHLRFSMSDTLPVFVCGGIGATPDDKTRICAARAANRPLVRHPDAAALIEGRFGPEAYPQRIHMADLPSGCELIANPYNQIPGFALNQHYFLPGFPEMAWPMAEQVLETVYTVPDERIEERSVKVLYTPESALIPFMETLSSRFSDLKMFSLPHMGTDSFVELGFRGRGNMDEALNALKSMLEESKIAYQEKHQ
jgi:molybdopterin-biosynthesis enzyme MoeA-like protein